MRAPAFWNDPDAWIAPLLLSPLGAITARATRQRLRCPGWRAPVPVICCGNIGVGGAGKTTLALDILRRLARRGIAAHALTRGYGGTARGILRVDPARHDAALTGDEALLLSQAAPTWIGADRAAAARQAVAAGARCLVMDDGMQNPGLAQDCTLLVIDGAVGFGNGRLLPAGPLRETVRDGAGRAHAAILIGPDRTQALRELPASLPVLRATLALIPRPGIPPGQRLFAFAGIGRPEKFFGSLDDAGLAVVGHAAFPDHHRFRAAELRRLAADAAACGARLATTAKDAVRLPSGFRAQVEILEVMLLWEDATLIDTLLDKVMTEHVTNT